MENHLASRADMWGREIHIGPVRLEEAEEPDHYKVGKIHHRVKQHFLIYQRLLLSQTQALSPGVEKPVIFERKMT